MNENLSVHIESAGVKHVITAHSSGDHCKKKNKIIKIFTNFTTGETRDLISQKHNCAQK